MAHPALYSSHADGSQMTSGATQALGSGNDFVMIRNNSGLDCLPSFGKAPQVGERSLSCFVKADLRHAVANSPKLMAFQSLSLVASSSAQLGGQCEDPPGSYMISSQGGSPAYASMSLPSTPSSYAAQPNSPSGSERLMRMRANQVPAPFSSRQPYASPGKSRRPGDGIALNTNAVLIARNQSSLKCFGPRRTAAELEAHEQEELSKQQLANYLDPKIHRDQILELFSPLSSCELAPGVACQGSTSEPLRKLDIPPMPPLPSGMASGHSARMHSRMALSPLTSATADFPVASSPSGYAFYTGGLHGTSAPASPLPRGANHALSPMAFTVSSGSGTAGARSLYTAAGSTSMDSPTGRRHSIAPGALLAERSSGGRGRGIHSRRPLSKQAHSCQQQPPPQQALMVAVPLSRSGSVSHDPGGFAAGSGSAEGEELVISATNALAEQAAAAKQAVARNTAATAIKQLAMSGKMANIEKVAKKAHVVLLEEEKNPIEPLGPADHGELLENHKKEMRKLSKRMVLTEEELQALGVNPEVLEPVNLLEDLSTGPAAVGSFADSLPQSTGAPSTGVSFRMHSTLIMRMQSVGGALANAIGSRSSNGRGVIDAAAFAVEDEGLQEGATFASQQQAMQAGIVQRSMLSLASGQSMALRSMTEGNSALSKSAAYLGRVQSNMAGLSTRVREELANNPTPSYMERPVGMTNTWR